MDSDAFREAATASIEEIIKYYDTLGERPVVSTVEPGYLRKLLPAEAPEEGEPWAAIQADVEAKIVPGITHWQSPNFFAFFPCPASYPSMLGELYSAAFAAAAFNWICSPAVTELETVVMDWLARLLGLPGCYLSTGPTLGGGVIHGTASEAVLTMMVAARDKYLRETTPADLWLSSSSAHDTPEDLEEEEQRREDALAARRARLVALGSASTHSSTRKAARILGLRYRAVPVRAEDGYAMTGAGLARVLRGCAAAGLEPFFLTATLGTTDTCAVDDFAGIADALAAFRREQRQAKAAAAKGEGGEGEKEVPEVPEVPEVWVHVDAAYAGSALVCPEQRAALNGGVAVLSAFHSFNVNMHKWLLTNFDASCVFVRDRRWLAQALGADWHVYRNAYSDGGLVTDYRDWQIPLGRRFRALKVWFVLRSYGAGGLRAYIRRTVALGERFAAGLRGAEREGKALFEILTGPRFALTVFRLAGGDDGASEEELSARTRRVYDAANASGRLWATGTVLPGGKFAIRVMTGNRLTEAEHVDAAVRLFVEEAGKVLAEASS